MSSKLHKDRPFTKRVQVCLFPACAQQNGRPDSWVAAIRSRFEGSVNHGAIILDTAGFFENRSE